MKTYTKRINLMEGDINVPYMLKLSPSGRGYNGGKGEVEIDISGMKINRKNENTVAELPSSYFTNHGCPLNFDFRIRYKTLKNTKNSIRGKIKRRLSDLVTTLIQEGKIRFISE